MPSGDDVYDALMVDIEPELVSVNIPHLDDGYTDESPEQRKARYERYVQAFEAYDKALAAWTAELKTAVDRCRREVIKASEQESRKQEEVKLSELNAVFSSPATHA